MPSSYQTIISEKKDGFAVITMNRPSKLNACNLTMYQEIDDALGRIEHDEDIHAVIITGYGDKAFSSGADIEELDFNDLAESTEYVRIDARAFRRLESIPQPVIAAVNGDAIGYGCKVAIVSDIVIASEKARFSLPGTTFGPVHVMTLGRGVHILGRRRLADMLLTGKFIDAQQAERYGIVTEVVPPEEVYKAAENTAKKIAGMPKLSVQVTRRMLHRGMDEDYRWEDLLTPGLLLMQDVKEGRKAFLEKRKPEFVGK